MFIDFSNRKQLLEVIGFSLDCVETHSEKFQTCMIKRKPNTTVFIERGEFTVSIYHNAN